MNLFVLQINFIRIIKVLIETNNNLLDIEGFKSIAIR